MEGNFIYEGNGDITLAFYQDDENVGTMPTKDSGYAFNAKKSYCDNDAVIKWDKNEWGPTILDLSKTKTKCNLYFVKAGAIRKIDYGDTKGMWNFRGWLTKIVIEKTKNKKEASEGQTVYGPYDESEKNDGSVESYVVCNSGNTNCIGYLQGEGGIELNIDSSYLFSNFRKVTQIEGMENLYTSLVTNMNEMFFYTQNLQDLDLSNFYTSYVTNMERMFGRIEIIQNLDISSFDTSNVTNMKEMFGGMYNLQTLTFGENFDTSSVTNMNSMFSNMSSIVELDLSTFDTSSVTDMGSMFGGMSSLEELNLSNFDTSKVTKMEYMFAGSSKLKKITYGSNFIHKDGANTSWMFSSCPANKPNKNVHSSWEGVSFN